MKIQTLNDPQIIEFCGLPEETRLLQIFKDSALAFIKSYTGLTEEEVNECEDLAIVYCILINEFTCNRDYVVSRDTINPSAKSILDLHSRNLIG